MSSMLNVKVEKAAEVSSRHLYNTDTFTLVDAEYTGSQCGPTVSSWQTLPSSRDSVLRTWPVTPRTMTSTLPTAPMGYPVRRLSTAVPGHQGDLLALIGAQGVKILCVCDIPKTFKRSSVQALRGHSVGAMPSRDLLLRKKLQKVVRMFFCSLFHFIVFREDGWYHVCSFCRFNGGGNANDNTVYVVSPNIPTINENRENSLEAF